MLDFLKVSFYKFHAKFFSLYEHFIFIKLLNLKYFLYSIIFKNQYVYLYVTALLKIFLVKIFTFTLQ